jgi:hypothetical protein
MKKRVNSAKQGGKMSVNTIGFVLFWGTIIFSAFALLGGVLWIIGKCRKTSEIF